MLNKKRLLILTLAILFLVAVMAACGYTKPDKFFEGQDIVDELIKEGAPTLPPTPAPSG